MILQTNIFKCEAPSCTTIASETHEVSPYDDQVVKPPDGWNFDASDLFVCPECLSVRKMRS